MPWWVQTNGRQIARVEILWGFSGGGGMEGYHTGWKNMKNEGRGGDQGRRPRREDPHASTSILVPRPERGTEAEDLSSWEQLSPWSRPQGTISLFLFLYIGEPAMRRLCLRAGRRKIGRLLLNHTDPLSCGLFRLRARRVHTPGCYLAHSGDRFLAAPSGRWCQW